MYLSTPSHTRIIIYLEQSYHWACWLIVENPGLKAHHAVLHYLFATCRASVATAGALVAWLSTLSYVEYR